MRNLNGTQAVFVVKRPFLSPFCVLDLLKIWGGSAFGGAFGGAFLTFNCGDFGVFNAEKRTFLG